MICKRLHSPLVAMHTTRPQPVHAGRAFRALGCVLAAMLAIGCGQANSTSPSKDDSMFGLFKSKSPSVVDPAVGAALVREASYPQGEAKPPAAAWPALRQAPLTAAPAQGRLSPSPIDQPPAEAWLVATASGTVALVNTYQPKRRVELWDVDRKDATRLASQRPLAIDPKQDKWLFYSAGEALALPGNKVVFDLNWFDPSPHDRLCVLDLATGAVKTWGPIEPDWPAGLPLHFIDSLQLTPEAVLVAYRTDKVRLAPERYVNRFDHLLLFSRRHPQGLEVARMGIDDGNVRDWRFAGGKLWLQTSDDRGDAPKAFNWSLDLSNVL